ncbi:MAG: hypothetical protein JNL71_17100 [Rhodospirillales bacterium]|nr:hypothetical protein [Rhodospirillales bacterium]
MDISHLMREGEKPAIAPNAGRHRQYCWTRADWGAYGESLRQAFPNILFYEEFGHLDWLEPKPEIRIFDRLDDPGITQPMCAFFPYPGWKPELIRVSLDTPKGQRCWTWAHYLSPRLRMFVRRIDHNPKEDWRGQLRDSPVEGWFESHMWTSYRREISEERRIESKAIRLAEKLCVRAVPVHWKSAEDFLAGRFRVSSAGLMLGDGRVSPRVIDWYWQSPNRAFELFVDIAGRANGSLPVEAVPDSAWGDIRRPKWAQRP